MFLFGGSLPFFSLAFALLGFMFSYCQEQTKKRKKRKKLFSYCNSKLIVIFCYRGKRSRHHTNEGNTNKMENTTKQQQPINENFFATVEQKDKLRALQLGFNLKKLAIFISSICANFTDKETPNSMDINDHYLWLYVYDRTTGQYRDLQNKYNNCKGWAIPNGIKEKTNEKILKNLLAFAPTREEIKKESKPQKDYYYKELANNKPLTLLKAKNEHFVCFVIFAHYGKINSLNISENKTEYEYDFLKIDNNYWDAKRIRKEAINVYAIYNKQMPDYRKEQEIIRLKKIQRSRIASTTTKESKRYFYNNKSLFNDLLQSTNDLHFYNFSYRSLADSQYDKVDGGLIVKCGSFEFLRTAEPMTRKQVFDYCVDKSGYCVIFYREKLLRRAETLRKQREQERKEKAQAEWIASNHEEQKQEINNILRLLRVNYIECSLTFDNFLKPYFIKRLDTLKDIYKYFENLLSFEKYTAESWQNKYNEYLQDWDFNKKIIDNNLYGSVACQHMYIKNGLFYEMKEQYKNDPVWGKYTHRF